MRTRGTRVGDTTITVDHDQALGPRSERDARRVVHAVDEDRHRQGKPGGGVASRGDPLIESRLLYDTDVLDLVRGELPLVDRVRLGDVHEPEVCVVRVPLPEGLDVARPTTERRSGVAAEDEHRGAPGHELVQEDRS